VVAPRLLLEHRRQSLELGGDKGIGTIFRGSSAVFGLAEEILLGGHDGIFVVVVEDVPTRTTLFRHSGSWLFRVHRLLPHGRIDS
jgi:hypothetical protein